MSGESYVWFGSAFLLLAFNYNELKFIPDQAKFAFTMSVALVSLVIGKIIKNTFKRRRPNQVFPNLRISARTPKDHSFPSSHTATSVSFFFALLVTQHPYAPMVGVWSAVVALSRFYLGVHFLSDVIGGIILGAFIGAGFGFLSTSIN